MLCKITKINWQDKIACNTAYEYNEDSAGTAANEIE